MRLYTNIDEFLASQPATKPGQPATKPGTSPGTRPTPSRPSPIRRDKPSTEPAPKAKLKDVMERFKTELRKSETPIKFNLTKLKAKYND
jgi:hypothetical protein